jgi:hypothetical protein
VGLSMLSAGTLSPATCEILALASATDRSLLHSLVDADLCHRMRSRAEDQYEFAMRRAVMWLAPLSP